MGFITNRISVIGTYLAERVRHGTPTLVGSPEHQVIFVLDGVGRLQLAPLMVRKVLREQGCPAATVLYDWQFGLVGEIWTDLMWLRRNRVMAAGLARKILAVRRDWPRTTIHVVAYSGGAGIALFACAYAGARARIDTLLLACPAVSPAFNLAPALCAVKRCYAMISPRDKWILGLGTRLFGTIDRSYAAAAGCTGFRIPGGLSANEQALYGRLREIYWEPALRKLGHPGGHTGWVALRFLRRHLLAMLRGEPLLPQHAVPAGES